MKYQDGMLQNIFVFNKKENNCLNYDVLTWSMIVRIRDVAMDIIINSGTCIELKIKPIKTKIVKSNRNSF